MSIADYKEIILDYLRDNAETPDREIARDLTNNPVPYSDRHIRRYIAELRREETPKQSYKDDIKDRKYNAQIKELDRKYRSLLTSHDKLNEAYDIALLIKEYRNYATLTIDPDSVAKTTAIPIIQLSDFHVGECVELGTTHGLNEVNPIIIRQRVTNLLQNTIRTIQKERVNHKIDTLVIWLGGDFINNYLHSHDSEMNHMAPIEELIFAEDLLMGYLNAVASLDGIKTIKVVCSRGNHARTTHKMQSSNDYKLSLEAMLYYNLSSKLNDPIFEWLNPESEFAYLDVFGKKLRFYHGHQIKSMGGIGGLTIPLNKQIHRYNDTIKADFNFMGHYHQYSMPNSTTSLNGSLVGFNSYAMSIGAKYEPPMQSFMLLDKKYGFTTRTPLFC